MNFYNPIEQPARIRLVHGASMAQPVDVYLNDRPIVRGLAYKQSTQYIPVPQGKYNVKIYTTSGNKLVLSQNLNVEGSKLITVMPKEGTDQLILKVTEEKMGYDQMPPFMQPGMGYPGMMQPGMEQYPDMMQDTEQYPGMWNNPHMMPPGFNSCEFGQCAMPYGMPKPENQNMMADQSIFNQPMYGNEQQPWQCGYQGQTPYQAPTRDEDVTERARVRFAHFSPNAPAVDITLPNGTVLFRNVPYKAVTDYLRVAPGTYTLQVRPTGTDQVVLTVPNVVINPNDIKTIYAIGLVNGTPRLEAFVLNDRRMMM